MPASRLSPATASDPPITITDGFDQVDEHREHLAEVPAGLAHGLDGDVVAAPHQRDDVVVPRRRTRAARSALASAGTAAIASRQPWLPHRQVTSAARGDVDVAEVAGGALGTALQRAPGDDAGADAGRDLDEHEVGHVGQVGVLLAQRHDVHVVVDEHRYVEGPLHVRGHVVPVPSGHDRRVDRAAGRVLDRTGQADPDRGQLAGVTTLVGEQLRDRRLRPSRARAPGRWRCRGPRDARRGRSRPGRRSRRSRGWRRGRRRPPPGHRG